MTLLTIYLLSAAFCFWFFRRDFYDALKGKDVNGFALAFIVVIFFSPGLNTMLALLILAVLVYDITESARAFRRKK